MKGRGRKGKGEGRKKEGRIWDERGGEGREREDRICIEFHHLLLSTLTTV